MARRRPFLLLSCMAALLLAACGAPEGQYEEFTFTAEEMAELDTILDQIEDGQGEGEGGEGERGAGLGGEQVVLDVSDARRFAHLQTSIGSLEENTFRVTNISLNVRAQPSVQSELLDTLKRGDRVTVLEFPNARWAHVRLPDDRKGYVAASYIAQVATEEELPRVNERYRGQYEVNFQFLNVRSEPNTRGRKLGELSAHEIVRPVLLDEQWARIPFGDGEGFVSATYLRPFSPNVIVRQERFTLPILHYRADEPQAASALVRHLAYLKSQGKKLITLKDFYELLLLQEERDERLPLDSVLLLVSDVTPQTLGDVSDALRASAAHATVFLRTSAIGPEGISPKAVRTLVANGNDVQSAGHSGEDLRALTNQQVTLDLAQSRQIIEDLTSRSVFAVAYPRGGVNDRIAEIAVETGYLFGVTLTPSAGAFDRSQFLRLPSNVIPPTTTEQALKSVVGIVQ